MIGSAFADMESLRIGTVIFASPDAIEVQLEIDAPDAVALNVKSPRRFPRINSYLMVPNDVGFTVGQVSWIKVVNSPYPKRKGLKDFGLIDLPYPLRMLSLSPIGMLQKDLETVGQVGQKFVFKRGVESFPSVGDGVLLPTNDQLAAIVTSGKDLRVRIGTSPLAANVDVRIDPDRLFGRHLAVLGNTGSGKSCSVAGLIRWSLEAAEKEIKGKSCKPNARFIILDPNGEYHHAFKDKNPTVFSISPTTIQQQLKLPVWLWNSEEWFSFSRAGERAHQPILRQAIREVKNSGGVVNEDQLHLFVRRRVSRIYSYLRQIINSNNYEGWRYGSQLDAFSADLEDLARKYPVFTDALKESVSSFKGTIALKRIVRANKPPSYQDFAMLELESMAESLKTALDAIGGPVELNVISEDSPVQFNSSMLLNHLEALVEEDGNPQLFGYFLSRIKMALSDVKVKDVLECGSDLTLSSWLEQILGMTGQPQLTIVDFSLVPPHLLFVLTSVVSRMVFEALQRHRQVTGTILPTVLVMEEAHNFIKRYLESSETPMPSQVCCKVFEKIAKEGRKFGLGLVLSSQRPSELSPTVLSQCIVNDIIICT